MDRPQGLWYGEPLDGERTFRAVRHGRRRSGCGGEPLARTHRDSRRLNPLIYSAANLRPRPRSCSPTATVDYVFAAGGPKRIPHTA